MNNKTTTKQNHRENKDDRIGGSKFLYNLSINLLTICDERKMTYEIASELCNLSSRHFGDIIRRQTSISVNVLEKICVGLNVLPQDLL